MFWIKGSVWGGKRCLLGNLKFKFLFVTLFDYSHTNTSSKRQTGVSSNKCFTMLTDICRQFIYFWGVSLHHGYVQLHIQVIYLTLKPVLTNLDAQWIISRHRMHFPYVFILDGSDFNLVFVFNSSNSFFAAIDLYSYTPLHSHCWHFLSMYLQRWK